MHIHGTQLFLKLTHHSLHIDVLVLIVEWFPKFVHCPKLKYPIRIDSTQDIALLYPQRLRPIAIGNLKHPEKCECLRVMDISPVSLRTRPSLFGARVLDFPQLVLSFLATLFLLPPAGRAQPNAQSFAHQQRQYHSTGTLLAKAAHYWSSQGSLYPLCSHKFYPLGKHHWCVGLLDSMALWPSGLSHT